MDVLLFVQLLDGDSRDHYHHGRGGEYHRPWDVLDRLEMEQDVGVEEDNRCASFHRVTHASLLLGDHEPAQLLGERVGIRHDRGISYPHHAEFSKSPLRRYVDVKSLKTWI